MVHVVMIKDISSGKHFRQEKCWLALKILYIGEHDYLAGLEIVYCHDTKRQ